MIIADSYNGVCSLGPAAYAFAGPEGRLVILSEGLMMVFGLELRRSCSPVERASFREIRRVREENKRKEWKHLYLIII